MINICTLRRVLTAAVVTLSIAVTTSTTQATDFAKIYYPALIDVSVSAFTADGIGDMLEIQGITPSDTITTDHWHGTDGTEGPYAVDDGIMFNKGHAFGKIYVNGEPVCNVSEALGLTQATLRSYQPHNYPLVKILTGSGGLETVWRHRATGRGSWVDGHYRPLQHRGLNAHNQCEVEFELPPTNARYTYEDLIARTNAQVGVITTAYPLDNDIATIEVVSGYTWLRGSVAGLKTEVVVGNAADAGAVVNVYALELDGSQAITLFPYLLPSTWTVNVTMPAHTPNASGLDEVILGDPAADGNALIIKKGSPDTIAFRDADSGSTWAWDGTGATTPATPTASGHNWVVVSDGADIRLSSVSDLGDTIVDYGVVTPVSTELSPVTYGFGYTNATTTGFTGVLGTLAIWKTETDLVTAQQPVSDAVFYLPCQDGLGPLTPPLDVSGHSRHALASAANVVLVPASADDVRSWNLEYGCTSKEVGLRVVMRTDAAGDVAIPVPAVSGYDGIIQWFDLGGDCISTNTFSDADMSAMATTLAPNTDYECLVTGDFPAMNFQNNLALIAVMNLGYTGITSLDDAFAGCANMISFAFGDTDAHLRVDSMRNTWLNCAAMTTAPDVGAFTLVYNLQGTWQGCASMATAPNTSKLTEVITLMNTWFGCTAMATTPDTSQMTKVTTLHGTWSGCSFLKIPPVINQMTLVSSLAYTWTDCVRLVQPPVITDLVNVMSLEATWKGCIRLRYAPDISNMPLIANFTYTWAYCSGLVTPPVLHPDTPASSLFYTWTECLILETAPDLSQLKYITDMNRTFRGCVQLRTMNLPDNASAFDRIEPFQGGTFGLLPAEVDAVFTKAAAWCRAHGDTPTTTVLDMGLQKRTAASDVDYAYLTGIGWNITSGGK